MLRLLHPMLQEQAELQRQVRMLTTLREVQAQDGGNQNLTPANAETLGAFPVDA